MICLPRRISNPCHFPPTGNVAGADQFPPPLPRHQFMSLELSEKEI